DAHPGGAGFADAVTVEVLRQVIRWSLALTRRCPRGCDDGCPGCVRIRRCHAEDRGELDKQGADRVLALPVGEAEAASFGPSRAPAARAPAALRPVVEEA